MKNFYLNKDMRLENETFIERFKKKHGSERYDFSKTKYESMRRSVTITCKLHGDFDGLPQHMLKKNHCIECKKDDSINKINNELTELNSNFRVIKKDFIKSTKPAKFVCVITGKESIKIPCQYINHKKKQVKLNIKQQAINNYRKQQAIEQKKQAIELIREEINLITKETSKPIVVNENISNQNLITLTCKIHNKSKNFRLYKIKKNTSNKDLINFCLSCKIEKLTINKLQEIKNKYSDLNFKDCHIERSIIKNIKCEKHNNFFDCHINKIIKKGQESCLECNKEKMTLKFLYPDSYLEILKEWNYEKNNIDDPESWVVILKERLNWICSRCKNSYKCSFRKKINSHNLCPNCNLKGSSKIERIIYYYLEKIFTNMNHNDFHYYDDNKFSYDMIILDLQPNLVIEYDGSFFHRSKYRFDKSKTSKIKKLGFNCLRIREFPLKNIQKHDIPFIFIDYENPLFEDNLKWLLSEIMNFIENNYVLSEEMNKKKFDVLNGVLDFKSIPFDYFIFPFKNKSLKEMYPKLIKDWAKDENYLNPDQISYCSQKLYYWKCNCGEIYTRTIKAKLNTKNKNNNICSECYNNLILKEKLKYFFDQNKKLKLRR
jgi:hypothetical protein